MKLRAVGGDLELGKMIETHARHRIHVNALRLRGDELKRETRHVRDRLENEQGRRRKHAGTDIKFGPGGMLDVYFAARYLQLRDEVPDGGDNRSTSLTLDRLREEGSLTDEDFAILSTGYGLLRTVDHSLRLILGRSTRLPVAEHPTARDVARRLGFESASALHATLADRWPQFASRTTGY